MEFSFEPTNIIKTVRRTAKVTIAGFVLAIAAVAAPIMPDLSNLYIPDPLEQTIAFASPSDRMPEWSVSKMTRQGIRVGLLESSLNAHGEYAMTDMARKLWSNMLSYAAEIPFEKVFAQYDPDSDSFFLVMNFKSGQRIEATTYVDEEDDDVYFSVYSKNKLFFQNVLDRNTFFGKAESIWGGFEENHV